MDKKIIDTNIFLRHFLQDIEDQSRVATSFIGEIENEKVTGLVSILVINELIWILEKYYQVKRNVYIPKIVKLFYLDSLKILEVKKDLIIKVLERMQKQKFDFTDIYLSQIAKKEQIFSFDQDFEKLYKNKN